MWDREYFDYKKDQQVLKNQLEPGKGISGCEMHELQGWGNTLHHHAPKKPGVLRRFIAFIKNRGRSA